MLLGAASCYAALMLAFAWGVHRTVRWTKTREATTATPRPFVSILVPARNEEAAIAACLSSILATTYPDERYEVIVIDDGSSDATVQRVRQLQHQYQPALAETSGGAASVDGPLRLLQRGEGPGGKHAALLEGLRVAHGDIVLTTDADCTVPQGWVDALVNQFGPTTGFVAGPVRYPREDSWWRRWQALEFAGLMAVAAGSMGLGRPTICSSANVAYRREVAQQHLLDAPRSTRPAVDEELAQRLAASTAWQVRFCATPDAVVDTAPPSTVAAFLDQRQRWALTGARFEGVGLRVLVGGLYGMFLLLLTGLLTCWIGGLWSLSVVVAFILKIGAEAAVLRPACRAFGIPYEGSVHGLGQLLHVPYIVLVSTTGLLMPPRWKGRTVFADTP